MLSLDESEVLFRPSWWASGINRVNRRPWSNWQRALAKYSKRYRGSGAKPGRGGREDVHVL